MTSITMSKRHRQPVIDNDVNRQSEAFTPDNTPTRPARKPVMTLHLPHRRDTALDAAQEAAQLSLLDPEPGA